MPGIGIVAWAEDIGIAAWSQGRDIGSVAVKSYSGIVTATAAAVAAAHFHEVFVYWNNSTKCIPLRSRLT